MPQVQLCPKSTALVFLLSLLNPSQLNPIRPPGQLLPLALKKALGTPLTGLT